MSSRGCTSVFLSLVFFIGVLTSSASSYSAFSSSAENTTLSALLHFKASVSDSAFLSSWNSSAHFCKWQGIVCAKGSSQVKELRLPDCGLYGTLSSQIGNLAPSLTHLDLSGNQFTGALPDALMNCSNLMLLDLSSNSLSGPLPSDWSKLASSLQQLHLQNNIFNGSFRALFNLTHSLELLVLSGNQLTGMIPPSLGQMKNLKTLDLSRNQLSAPLPSSLGPMQSLEYLDLSHNQVSGPLPSSLGQMQNLEYLDLSHNQLSGPLPSSLGQMTSLQTLILWSNHLSGPLPTSLGQIKSLQYLDFSWNQLSGPLPSSLGQMKSLQKLHLWHNELSGPLPSLIGQMKSLQGLVLSRNQFYGPLPSSLGEMEGLKNLDLSQNLLFGQVPSSLGNMKGLQTLDLSGNQLSGPLPTSLYRFPSSSFLGNPGLCGPSFITTCTSHSKSNMKLYILVSACVVVGEVSLLAAFCACWHFFKKRDGHGSDFVLCQYKAWLAEKMRVAWWHFFKKRDRHGSDFVVPRYKAWTTEEMRVATNDFDAANVIGLGAVSMCYLGVMKAPEGMRVVAIKRLTVDEYDGEDDEGRKSFVNEFKTLCKMRHRNLVKVLGYCVERAEIALVMEYMEKGDLDMHLHNKASNMSWEERVNVALDVAEGLVYLHHEYDHPLIHCDIKPKNILLSSNMVAKISDFGTAKLLQGNETGDMSMSKLRGTFGYIAPEYGMGSRISTKVDVYSYGMLLLELVTGVIPTSRMLEEEAMSLRTWVEKLHASGRIREALRDYNLAILQEAENLLRLGIQCTHDVAKKRPTMYIVRDCILELKRQRL